MRYPTAPRDLLRIQLTLRCIGVEAGNWLVRLLEEGAAITETTPAAFRKRLSRARLRLRAFMPGHCGLVTPALTCQCGGGVRSSAEPADAEEDIERAIGHWQHIYRIAAIYRGHPRAEPPDVLARSQRMERQRFT